MHWGQSCCDWGKGDSWYVSSQDDKGIFSYQHKGEHLVQVDEVAFMTDSRNLGGTLVQRCRMQQTRTSATPLPHIEKLKIPPVLPEEADSVFSDFKKCICISLSGGTERWVLLAILLLKEKIAEGERVVFFTTDQAENKDSSSRGQVQNNSGTGSSVGKLCPRGLCLDYALTSTRG